MHRGKTSLRGSPLAHLEQRSVRRQWECALLLGSALAAASFAPHPLVLPVVSVLLLLSALFTSAYAWLRSETRMENEFTRWDQAGILTFAGFAAALIGDSAEIVEVMERLIGPRYASN